ncbi:unannotated protein [freshwater metagenome]|uniref:Unannotated protein n=1 Tax=freshwater metagenome TaxID=449393 RepID=A0A6J7LQJ4_9ZZZZ
MGLQVDALPRGIRREEDPDRLLGGLLGELRADVLAFLRGRRPLNDRQHVGIAVLREHAGQPVDGVGVLAEHDDALVRPVLAVGSADRVEVAQEGPELGVGAALVRQAPADEGLELSWLCAAQRIAVLRVTEPLGLVLLPQALFLVGLALAEDVVVVLIGEASAAAAAQVVAQCLAERVGAGEESLLEQHRHDVAGGLGAVELRAPRDDLVEQREHLLLVLCRLERLGADPSGLEPLSGEIALQPSDGDVPQRRRIEQRAPREPSRIDHFHEGRERLRMPVVRSGTEEEPVLAPVGEVAHCHRPLRVDGVGPATGDGRRARRCNVVGLVDDEDVEREPLAGLRGAGLRVGVAQQSLGPHLRQPCHAHDHPREHLERVRVQAVGAPHLGEQLAVDDREVEPELVAHLVLPLQRQAGRAHDDDRARPVAQQQLLNDEARLDRLAKPDIVGEQQVGTGCRQGTPQWLKLVCLDVDS